MKIKSLKIGAHRFTVGDLDQKEAEVGGCEGYTSVSTDTSIMVADHYPEARRAEILIHEIMHALLWDAGLAWNDKNAEKWICRVSPRVAALFADNPKEIKLLLEMFKSEA